MAPITGASIIAQSLKDLGVTVIFGIVGIPIVEIAERAIDLGIRFIGFRNEQAASYAASAYGFLTGRPGVCLVVGGPGVLHAVAGIGNSHVNAFPLLLLAGSAESRLVSRGAFQELDAVALLIQHTKAALRPQSLDSVPDTIRRAYRLAQAGRPSTGFVDFPADLIEASVNVLPEHGTKAFERQIVASANTSSVKINELAQVIKAAKAPLVVIGKGAAYARAEKSIRDLIDKTNLFFLPTPMGKGVVSDSHKSNVASARSVALKEADVVLLLGARLNWILHFGDAPKWNANARFIQVDISAEEIGQNGGDEELGVVGDLQIVVPQLIEALDNWSLPSPSPFESKIDAARARNEAKAAEKAASARVPMTYEHSFQVIEQTLRTLSPPDEGGVVYVSEGANTMDKSRSVFSVSHPRLRLDAGTHATMGVGLGYAIAAHAAYNGKSPDTDSGPARRKKIVAFEGDSAFGFSALEVETMARYQMDILIFVMNNGGIYHGDSDDATEWLSKQMQTLQPSAGGTQGSEGLRSTSLGWAVGYEKIAEACGGVGYVVHTPAELERATRAGFAAQQVCVINVMIESGKGGTLEFGWQASKGGDASKAKL